MECPRCRYDNGPQAKFCEECGAPVTRRCASCGAALSATAKFCPECAHPASAGATAPGRFASPHAYTPPHLVEKILTKRTSLEGERKQVTVLFADLRGSMELLADRDPEEARNLLDPVLERMMDAVHRYEGTVNQVMGDGIMALFGAPVAHEDHTVRACYAALKMHDAVAQYADELRRKHGADVQIRVGLNCGEVVVRSIGSDLHVDYTAVGQTTHLAARMEQLARPGTTLITDDVVRATEGYVHVKPLGPMPIKGLSEPIPVYELVGAAAARTRLQVSAARGLTRFVGRSFELEQLRYALEEARTGHGQVVALVGEPGVGKSRLFYEFVHSHRVVHGGASGAPGGWLVLESSSVSYGKATPYLPLVDLLKAYFKIADGDDKRAVRAKVTGTVLTVDEALKDDIAPLLWLLEAVPEEHEFSKLDAGRRRTAALESIKRLLLRESRSQPLLLVFEDLHWIDGETQAFLDMLVESLPNRAVLLAVNYRPEYQHGWGNKTCYRQLRIDPLPRESAEALLQPLLGDDPSLQPLQRLLVQKTEGNPLFLEECVRTLAETDVLVGERGAYRLEKDPGTVQVPPTVQAILAARIDRLPGTDKHLLQAASVIGKDLPWGLLLGVSELPEDELRRGLARLQAAEFVYEAKLFPDLEYTFKHALTHEVAYGSLLQDRRRVLHARIVDAIEGLYAGRLAEHLDELAHHAFRAELWNKGLQYLHQTGSFASQPSIDAALGGPQSPGHLWWRGLHDRALALAQWERKLAASYRNFPLTVTANFRLGQAYHSVGEYAKAVEVLTHNVGLLEADLQGETFGLAGFPSVFSRAWLVFCLAEQGAFDAAIPYAEEAVAIADGKDHAFSLVVALTGLGMLHARRDDYGRSAAALERALTLGREADISILFPFVAAPLGWVYGLAGRSEEGVQLLVEAIDRADATHFAANHARRLAWLGEVHLLRGQGDEAKRMGLRALEFATRHGERGHEAHAWRLLADVEAKGAQPDQATAAEHYRRARALAEAVGMRPLIAELPSQ